MANAMRTLKERDRTGMSASEAMGSAPDRRLSFVGSRATLVAELATAHGGDLDLAADMIRAAADSGADLVKIQTYSLAKLNPADPQADWLKQAHLDKADHEHLLRVAQQAKIELFSTPFDADSLQMLRDLGLKRFKIASSESGNGWWQPHQNEQWIVSWPWGLTNRPEYHVAYPKTLDLTAIPLYPTPLECVGRAPLLDGWSDHCEGIEACQWALAQGVQVLEAHLCLPGTSRVKSWDKTPADFRALRRFAEDVATMRSGVSQAFRDRWSGSQRISASASLEAPEQ